MSWLCVGQWEGVHLNNDEQRSWNGLKRTGFWSRFGYYISNMLFRNRLKCIKDTFSVRIIMNRWTRKLIEENRVSQLVSFTWRSSVHSEKVCWSWVEPVRFTGHWMTGIGLWWCLLVLRCSCVVDRTLNDWGLIYDSVCWSWGVPVLLTGQWMIGDWFMIVFAGPEVFLCSWQDIEWLGIDLWWCLLILTCPCALEYSDRLTMVFTCPEMTQFGWQDISVDWPRMEFSGPEVTPCG